MGLLIKLTTLGSNLTKYDGATPPINPLATKSSTLHAAGNVPGYSLNGNTAAKVIYNYGLYDDGVNNAVPQPSQLDLNGKRPTAYLDNPPK